MIKINLLESSKGKNKRGGSNAPSMPTMEMGDMGSPKLKVLVVLILAGAVNFSYWYRLDRQGKAIAVQIQAAEQKTRELSDVKARYLERQTQANNYKRRVDVIDSLRNAGQTGPVNLLAMLGETVNGTEAVWLKSMDDTGNTVSLEGTSLSTDAVATLLANLQKTGFFKNVEIKETYQDDSIKDMQAFQFTLTCEKGKA
ncbi:MAG: PilN domain-containing protein [Candidatus Sulfotelmatobacter sp.]